MTVLFQLWGSNLLMGTTVPLPVDVQMTKLTTDDPFEIIEAFDRTLEINKSNRMFFRRIWEMRPSYYKQFLERMKKDDALLTAEMSEEFQLVTNSKMLAQYVGLEEVTSRERMIIEISCMDLNNYGVVNASYSEQLHLRGGAGFVDPDESADKEVR